MSYSVEILQIIKDSHEKGDRYVDVAKALNMRGYKTVTGKVWSSSSVSNLAVSVGLRRKDRSFKSFKEDLFVPVAVVAPKIDWMAIAGEVNASTLPQRTKNNLWDLIKQQ